MFRVIFIIFLLLSLKAQASSEVNCSKDKDYGETVCSFPLKAHSGCEISEVLGGAFLICGYEISLRNLPEDNLHAQINFDKGVYSSKEKSPLKNVYIEGQTVFVLFERLSFKERVFSSIFERIESFVAVVNKSLTKSSHILFLTFSTSKDVDKISLLNFKGKSNSEGLTIRIEELR